MKQDLRNSAFNIKLNFLKMNKLLQTKKLFLFDFDGTLMDTSHGILLSINHTRAHYGLEPLTFEQAHVHIGTGRVNLIKKILSPNTSSPKAFEIYCAHHDTHMYEQVHFYNGLTEFLAELRAENKKIAIVSNKYKSLIEKILAYLKAPIKFDLIIGPDVFPELKPSPAPLLHVCKQFNVAPQDAVMFGDSIYDVEAGKSAGIYTVGCSWGFNGTEPFQKNPPDLIIRNIAEIL